MIQGVLSKTLVRSVARIENSSFHRQRQILFSYQFSHGNQRNFSHNPVPQNLLILKCNQLDLTRIPQRTYSVDKKDNEPNENPGIVKRFKQMFKDYWYVLLPVHVATSIVW